MTVYEEAARRWVAEQLDIDWTTIREVAFGAEVSTCGEGTCDYEVPMITVKLFSGTYKWLYPYSEDKQEGGLSFGQMIQGICELAASLESPSPTGIRTLQDEASNAYQAADEAVKESDRMRNELQTVIRTARGALADMTARFETLGRGVE